jgi:predicted transcriptional regulator
MSVAVVIPIHSKYAEGIFSGEKRYEYRKTKPTKTITYFALYETAPISKIVGIVEVTECLSGAPDKLWAVTNGNSGMTKQNFDNYSQGKETIHAFSLGKVMKLKSPITMKSIGFDFAPQSFCYLSDSVLAELIAMTDRFD